MIVPETHKWAQENFGECSLGDQRRTARLVQLAGQAADKPAASLPDLTGSWKGVKAAYRLLDRPEATLESVTQAHRDRTRRQSLRRCLIISDTTDVNFGAHRQIEGAGRTGTGRGKGFLLHSALMLDASNGHLIGLAGQAAYYRPWDKIGRQSDAQRLSRRRESEVWGEVIDRVGAPPEGSEWIHIGDSAADNFEVFCRCQDQGADWVFRAGRRHRKILTPEGKRVPMTDYLQRLPVVGEYHVEVRARDGRPARTAHVEVSIGSIRMPAPQHASSYVKERDSQPIAMSVVYVREVDPPSDVEPLEWILYTSLPVEDFDDAMEVIGYYQMRWLIEEWHKALKTGCRLTHRQLQSAGGLEALTGVFSVVSVLLIQLKTLARTAPARRAREVVPPLWLKLLRAADKVKNTKGLTLRGFWRAVAKLGGFLGRKSDGEPGWITIWRGWQQLHLLTRGVRLAQSIPALQ
jgi:hypothetical protein